MRLNCQLAMVANRQATLATVEDLPRRRPGDSHPPHGNDKSRSEAGEDLVGFRCSQDDVPHPLRRRGGCQTCTVSVLDRRTFAPGNGD